MNKSIILLILPTMLVTPIITLSLNSWLSMWIAMEINFMSYLPFMIYFNKFNKNISNKYFIIQSVSSTIFLMGVCLDMLYVSNYMNAIMTMKISLFNLSIIIKLGLPPFHEWLIDAMKNMSWINCIMLSTWQKIIPMIIMSHIFNVFLIYVVISISLLIVPLGLNFSSTKMIMSISSINQMSWTLLIMINNEPSWGWYFIFYMILSASLMFFFKKFKINHINQMSKMNDFAIFYLIMMIIAISGMPPFMGFFIKLIAIKAFPMTPFIFIYLIMSTLTFIMYMRICYKLLLHNLIFNKIKLAIKFNKLTFLEIFIFSAPLIFWLVSFTWTG